MRKSTKNAEVRDVPPKEQWHCQKDSFLGPNILHPKVPARTFSTQESTKNNILGTFGTSKKCQGFRNFRHKALEGKPLKEVPVPPGGGTLLVTEVRRAFPTQRSCPVEHPGLGPAQKRNWRPLHPDAHQKAAPAPTLCMLPVLGAFPCCFWAFWSRPFLGTHT
eukprot:EG_transcript_26404